MAEKSETLLEKERLLVPIKKNARDNLKEDRRFVDIVLSEARKSQKSSAVKGIFVSKRLW